ncbi:MAG: efflux transporter periplasmic adaptor subunit, partial [Sulfurimonas sp.]|nr:efflux transporter periplasmic adaptor subunit [Sulfurimonas sp.]
MIRILLSMAGLIFTLNAAEVYATFNVEAEKNAMLAFDAGGITQSVNYGVANSVKKGKILASLQNADKKASLNSAQTALKFAKKDYERQLKVKNLIDAGKFDQYAFKYENAKNQVAFAQAQYDKT